MGAPLPPHHIAFVHNGHVPGCTGVGPKVPLFLAVPQCAGMVAIVSLSGEAKLQPTGSVHHLVFVPGGGHFF